MAYAHCHACGWEQDDFWSDLYNPIRSLVDWEKTLLEFGTLDVEYERDGEKVVYRETIAAACENAARRIRGMVFLTPKGAAWQPCPKCGHKYLDVD